MEASTAHTGWKKVFFWAGRCTGKEIDGKLFIISSECERNISKYGCFFYDEVFLFGFVIGEKFCSKRVTKESGTSCLCIMYGGFALYGGIFKRLPL